jgi:hypothetical protein
LYIIIRIQLLDPSDTEEIAMINDLQRQFSVNTGSKDEFPEFAWDRPSLDSLRNLYNEEAKKMENFSGLMGRRGEVNEELRHLAAAAGWGLLPDEASTYLNYSPGVPADKCYSATYEVPENDAFWSITVYGADGFIKTENCIINETNVKFNDDGTFTIHYGSAEQCGDAPNRLDAPEGWNFVFRIYKPGSSVLDGSYTIPDVAPVE